MFLVVDHHSNDGLTELKRSSRVGDCSTACQAEYVACSTSYLLAFSMSTETQVNCGVGHPPQTQILRVIDHLQSTLYFFWE